MCCMNTTIAADRSNFKVTFQVAFWGPIRPNFEYNHVAIREVRYLTDGVLPIFMSFAAIQSGFMLLFQGLVTCWNLTQTGPPRLYSFRTVQYSSCNFQVFFYQLSWTQTCPEGMGMNETQRSHARCHPFPIPQRVKVGHTTKVNLPCSFRTVMWVLLHPTRTEQWKCCEMGPMVFHPYLRRLERLTIWSCHYKGNTFFSVI